MLRRNFLASAAAAGLLRGQSRLGVHPRLHLDPARVRELRTLTGTSHAAIWKLILQVADPITARTPNAYTEAGASTNDEQLWQRDVGNNMPYPALAFLMTGGQNYLNAAKRWALASCGYPHWGLGTEDGKDLAAAHQLYGLALVYDWLFDDLDATTRETIRRTLIDRGGVMERAASTMYWRESYLQNHLWVSMTGLAAAGFALHDDAEAAGSAARWVALALSKFRKTEDALGPDGASHEGVGYWSYGVEYMLKFWHLAETLLGEKPASAWWEPTAAYRQYLGLPRAAWTSSSSIVDIADCPRMDWYGPEYLLRRLASLHRDGYAQWLAAELETARVTANAARWLNLIWYDPTVPPVGPATLPLMRHFEDMGIVSSRSDWNGSESLVVFKCGPPIGHDATPKFSYDPGSGHVHPDANHFVVFGNGEWLLSDDGYRWKQTNQHNTLIVDGKGQMGEGSQWFQGSTPIRLRSLPRIVAASSFRGVDLMIGDSTAAYPSDLGLKQYIRKLVFLKPSVLLVIDEIETTASHSLELRFHPESRGERVADQTWLFSGKKSKLRLEVLTPSGVDASLADVAAKDRDGAAITMNTVRLVKSASSWRNAVALSWSDAGGEPPEVKLDQTGGQWVFRAVNWTVTL